ncbi:hypothetical protein PENTCL1PPCAC_4368, partial [Pristionchus entomophagus]
GHAEKSEEETPAVEVVPREKTAEEIAFEEEEARIAAQKTLAEFRAGLKKDDKKFNLRQAAADDGSFGKLVPLQKERIVDETTTEEEVIEVVKKEPRNKQIIVDFKFNEPNRGEFGGRIRGGDRGRRGGGGGDRRGARTGRGGAGSGSARYNEPFRVAEDAFPALGKA